MTPERLVGTNEAAFRLRVPPATIRKWRSRGLVEPAGLVPGPGRTGLVPLYRLADLQPQADAYHRRARPTGTTLPASPPSP